MHVSPAVGANAHVLLLSSAELQAMHSCRRMGDAATVDCVVLVQSMRLCARCVRVCVHMVPYCTTRKQTRRAPGGDGGTRALLPVPRF
jgi:hypothetical protein